MAKVPLDNEEVLTSLPRPTPMSAIAYRLCQCYSCGITRRATPNFDFYRAVDTEMLCCEKCLMQKHFGKDAPDVIMLPGDDEDE